MMEGIAQGISGRRAAGRNDVAQAAQAEPHGDLAGERPDGTRRMVYTLHCLSRRVTGGPNALREI